MSYRRSKERKKRLKQLEKETWHSYGAGAYYDEDKKRYIKYSCHNSWLKKHSRRMIRHRLKEDKEIFQKGCKYKRKYDYWWILL